MDVNSKFIKGTSLEGIEYFERALQEYIQKTRVNIASVKNAQQSVGSSWNDSKYEEAKLQTEEFLAIERELTNLQDLLLWIGQRKAKFAEAMAIFEELERSI